MQRHSMWLALVLLSIQSVNLDANEIYTPVADPIEISTAPLLDAVPSPQRVPGKEYTDRMDMTHVTTPHSPSTLQLGVFDGLGGAADGINLSSFAPNLDNLNVDAQSSVRDRFLYEPLVTNQIPLIFSTSLDNMLGGTTALAAELASGARQTFADATQVVNHPHAGGQLRDIDSVDLWGVEGVTGTNVFSIDQDALGTSLYFFNGIFVSSYLTQADIAGAIGMPDLAPVIDVDAVFANDIGTGMDPFDGEFGPGDEILFSIAPIADPDGQVFFDGGEIWRWRFGSPATFLDHGGHLWDTAFDVQGTFLAKSENVDALETVTVPEPATAILSLAVAVCLLAEYRRK